MVDSLFKRQSIVLYIFEKCRKSALVMSLEKLNFQKVVLTSNCLPKTLLTVLKQLTVTI